MNPFERTPEKSLRLWPGVAIAALTVAHPRHRAAVSPDGNLIAVLAPLAGGALICLWWLFLSRVRWTERLGVAAVLIAAGAATYYLIHPSIRGGLMGRMFPLFFAIPGLAFALVVWAVADAAARIAARVSRRSPPSSSRRADCSPRFEPTDCSAANRSSHGGGRRPRRNACSRRRLPEPAAAAAPAARHQRRRRPRRESERCHARAVRDDAGASRARSDTGRREPAGPLARLSRTGARQRRARRADRDGLGGVTAGRDLEAPDRTGVVVVRGCGAILLHAGAARRRRSRVLLPAEHRRAGVDAQGRRPVLRVERRPGPRGTPTVQRRPRLRAWRDRHPERARRRDRRSTVVAQRR